MTSLPYKKKGAESWSILMYKGESVILNNWKTRENRVFQITEFPLNIKKYKNSNIYQNYKKL